jgi:hypothetical protein
VGGGGEHAAEGAELFSDEVGDIEEVFALDEDGEVVTAAHQEALAHLVKLGDAACETVKATFALGGDAHFDERGDAFLACFLTVDDGIVTQDRAVGLGARRCGGALRLP